MHLVQAPRVVQFESRHGVADFVPVEIGRTFRIPLFNDCDARRVGEHSRRVGRSRSKGSIVEA